MKRISIIIAALCVCTIMSAQRKVDKMDENKWGWTEWADKYSSVTFEDGFMVIHNYKLHKGVKNIFDPRSLAYTFVKLPVRSNEDYKLTIKCIQPDLKNSVFTLFFNTSKKCLSDDAMLEEITSSSIVFWGNKYQLIPMNQNKFETLPIKVTKNNRKDFPMEIVITKRNDKATIEVNGIQIFKGDCAITEQCMGFAVPLKQSLKVDEIIVEQAERNDD